MSTSQASLAELRRAWRCDCGGAADEHAPIPRAGVSAYVLGAKAGIKEITGHEPPTCPWRSFYDPIVSRVIGIATLANDGLAMAELGTDPPAVVLDGLRTYLAARNATKAFDWQNDPNNPKNRKQRPK